VKPDLQYVHDPAAIRGTPDALVGTIQVITDF
jgi:carbohydrate-selective porin OprB